MILSAAGGSEWEEVYKWSNVVQSSQFAPFVFLMAQKKPGQMTGLNDYGGDLLFRLRSTISANELNYSVRNGKR